LRARFKIWHSRSVSRINREPPGSSASAAQRRNCWRSVLCETLIQDVRKIGFDVSHFDFHEYEDETDAYSQFPGENLSIKFVGLEIIATRWAAH
jgi:hypothetical protein